MEGPFLAALYAGLRRGEIAHVRLEYIDREAGLLEVRPFESWQTKNRKSRSVPLHPRLVAVLPEGASGWAFPRTTGKPWPVWSLSHQMKAVTGHGLHVLRHTFVSRLMAAGVGASVVRDLAGHSSISVTDRYAHTNLDELRDGVARL